MNTNGAKTWRAKMYREDQPLARQYHDGRNAFLRGEPLDKTQPSEWLRGYKVQRGETRFNATIAARRAKANAGSPAANDPLA